MFFVGQPSRPSVSSRFQRQTKEFDMPTPSVLAPTPEKAREHASMGAADPFEKMLLSFRPWLFGKMKFDRLFGAALRTAYNLGVMADKSPKAAEWACTKCRWTGPYKDTAPVMYRGRDWQNCPSCGAAAIPGNGLATEKGTGDE